jgi:hypothetical protein
MMIKIVVLCTVKDLKEVHFIHCSLKVALMGLSKTVYVYAGNHHSMRNGESLMFCLWNCLLFAKFFGLFV